MSPLVLDSVLVADSGVDAVRVLTTLQRLGVRAVGAHTELDADALPARLADESVLLAATPAAYGDVVKLVEAARQGRASGVHPGGRLVPGLREAVLAADLQWLGDPLVLPVSWSGVVARPGGPTTFAALPPRAVEVVSGVDAVAAALGVEPEPARGGCAVSVQLVTSDGCDVTGLEVLEAEDLWWDLAVGPGAATVGPLLGIVTAWAVDERAAWELLADAAARSVVEGPVVDLPDLVRRARP